jgi:hypothetical protein
MTNTKPLEPLEICWRVLEASSSRIVTCKIFGAPTSGVELRVGYSDALLHTQLMPDIESARVSAQNWIDAMRKSAGRSPVS